MRRLPDADWMLNQHYFAYRETAQHKKREFTLTRKQFRDLVKAPCHYCGRTETKTMRRVNNFGNAYEYRCNGVDRYDNDQGYTPENCVPCCEDCNRAKLQMSAEAFIYLCHLVSERHSIKPQSEAA